MRFFPPIATILLAVCIPAQAEIPMHAQRVATGLSLPLFATSAPGDPNRLYILEQRGSGGVSTSGAVRILDLNTGSLTTFLTIPGLANSSEQGALGLAFHPDYATNGKFYLDVTDSTGQTQIRQYTRMDANTASTVFSTVLAIDQPQANHNGGWMGFGPNDGYLYINTGDGGNFNDQGTGHTADIGNAQDTSTLLGKILRLDVNGTDVNGAYSIPAGNPFAGATEGADEIWAYGLRNPWRASFDRGGVGGGTGDFYIGDVGQGLYEEIDFQPAGATAARNYGWRAREGLHDTGLMPVPVGTIDPIHEYDHSQGNAVVGGYVYRGSENDALNGTYFFADNGSGRIWSLKFDGATVSKFREVTGDISYDPMQDISFPSSFGEDAEGNLYITDLYDGEVFRLVPALPGDADQNGLVNSNDLGLLAMHWQQQSSAGWADGDFTDDGKVDLRDLVVLATHWQQSSAALAAALNANGLPVDVVPEPTMGMMLVSILPLFAGRRLIARRRGFRPVPHHPRPA